MILDIHLVAQSNELGLIGERLYLTSTFAPHRTPNVDLIPHMESTFQSPRHHPHLDLHLRTIACLETTYPSLSQMELQSYPPVSQEILITGFVYQLP